MIMEFRNLSKEDLLKKLDVIRQMGWVHTSRTKNDGAVGNTLEDLLEIPENNLSIANTVDWELKAQRESTSSMVTLFHLDPMPRKPKSVVANFILPTYGWGHKEAGKLHSSNELSFRATLNGRSFMDRGFILNVNGVERVVEVIFDPDHTSVRHAAWSKGISTKHSLERKVLCFWSFDDLQKKCIGKIRNTIYVVAESRINNGQEEFRYVRVMLLEDFAFNRFLKGLIEGDIKVDFDARTGKNHGTKFRIKQNSWPVLFARVTELPMPISDS